MMKKIPFYIFAGLLLPLLAACGGPAETATPAATPQVTPTTIDQSFQSQIPTPPKTPMYMCGAWASNRSPSMYSVITIYAKLTHDTKGVVGAPATGTIHFAGYDAPLGTATSDSGGYAVFTLALQGRQPRMTPATIDISFSVQQKTVTCSQAFFTPQ